MRKMILVLAFLLVPMFVQAQSLKLAIFGNAAATSNALVIGNKDLFTGLIVPDDINSDLITFSASFDGTNYYPLFSPFKSGVTTLGIASDSTDVYSLAIADTLEVYFTTLPERVFRNIRRIKIILDANTSASQDTILVMYRSN